jgi:hypothetical protein
MIALIEALLSGRALANESENVEVLFLKGICVRKSIAILICSALLGSLCFLSCSKNGQQYNVSKGDTKYYVDSELGNDSYAGNSPDSAWQTLSRVNDTLFAPGDFILFKCGGVWTGQLYPKGSGKDGNPIVIDKYGQGELPRISGAGQVENAVYLFNQECWEINNLDISNFSESGPALRKGMYIQAEDFGAVHHIHMKNLVVHDVNGSMETRKNGGIFVEVTVPAVRSRPGLRISWLRAASSMM